MQMLQNVSWIRPPAARFPDFGKTLYSCFDESHVARPRMAVFRGVSDLDEEPENLVALFSGDTKFRLYVNGRFVDDGPVEVGGDYAKTDASDWWFVSRRDLAPFLRMRSGPLTFAEGEVPIVRGAIRFRWENGKLKIRVPENIRCEVNSKYETEVP